jgi:acyl-CoA thioesterase
MSSATAPEPADDLAASLGQDGPDEIDAKSGRAVVRFRAALRMCHSGGVVQGGFVAGWLDAAMSRAAMGLAGMHMAPMTLELKVSYFAPVGPGPVIAEGWVERRGRSTCFLEGRLLNAAGEVLAKASSTARMIERAKVVAWAASRER